MTIEDVVTELDVFVPADEGDNIGRLYEIFGRLKSLAPELRKKGSASDALFD